MLELDHIKIRSNILIRTIGIEQFIDSSKPRYFPRFLVKMSNSYFIRVGDYARAFLLELADKLAILFPSTRRRHGKKKALKYLLYDDVASGALVSFRAIG